MADDLNSRLPWTNPGSGQGRTWTRGLRISSSALEDLNSGRPWTNPASGQGRTWTRGLRISSSALEDLNSGRPWTNPASGQGRTWTRGLRISSSALEDLNSRRPGRNPTSGQSGTWTRGLRTASPALQPLGHAASVTSPYVEKWLTSEGGFNSVNKKTFPLKRLLFGWKCSNYNRRQIAETLSSNRETSKTKQSTPLPLLLSCLNYCNKKWYHEKLLLNSFDLNSHRTLALRSLRRKKLLLMT